MKKRSQPIQALGQGKEDGTSESRQFLLVRQFVLTGKFSFFPLYFAAPALAVIVVIVTLLPNITPHYVRTTCPPRVCLAHKGLYGSLDIYPEHCISVNVNDK